MNKNFDQILNEIFELENKCKFHAEEIKETKKSIKEKQTDLDLLKTSIIELIENSTKLVFKILLCYYFLFLS